MEWRPTGFTDKNNHLLANLICGSAYLLHQIGTICSNCSSAFPSRYFRASPMATASACNAEATLTDRAKPSIKRPRLSRHMQAMAPSHVSETKEPSTFIFIVPRGGGFQRSADSTRCWGPDQRHRGMVKISEPSFNSGYTVIIDHDIYGGVVPNLFYPRTHEEKVFVCFWLLTANRTYRLWKLLALEQTLGVRSLSRRSTDREPLEHQHHRASRSRS